MQIAIPENLTKVALMGTAQQGINIEDLIASLPEQLHDSAHMIVNNSSSQEEAFLRISALYACYHRACFSLEKNCFSEKEMEAYQQNNAKVVAAMQAHQGPVPVIVPQKPLEQGKELLPKALVQLFQNLPNSLVIWFYCCTQLKSVLDQYVLPPDLVFLLLDKSFKRENLYYQNTFLKIEKDFKDLIIELCQDYISLSKCIPGKYFQMISSYSSKTEEWSKQTWLESTHQERLIYLRKLRADTNTAPLALEFLSYDFEKNKANNRYDMIDCLSQNLSSSDVAFLMAIKDNDRSKDVKTRAITLLKFIQHSPVNERLRTMLKTHVRLNFNGKDLKDSTDLVKDIAQATWEYQDFELDEELKSYNVDEFSMYAKGEKLNEFLLRSMAHYVDLDLWQELLQTNTRLETFNILMHNPPFKSKKSVIKPFSGFTPVSLSKDHELVFEYFKQRDLYNSITKNYENKKAFSPDEQNILSILSFAELQELSKFNLPTIGFSSQDEHVDFTCQFLAQDFIRWALKCWTDSSYYYMNDYLNYVGFCVAPQDQGIFEEVRALLTKDKELYQKRLDEVTEQIKNTEELVKSKRLESEQRSYQSRLSVINNREGVLSNIEESFKLRQKIDNLVQKQKQ